MDDLIKVYEKNNVNFEKYKTKDSELARQIHDNPKLDVYETLTKIISDDKAMNEILAYELEYYVSQDKVNTFDEFVAIAQSALAKFQCKAGGHTIEDNEWILLRESNHRFKLKPNQTVLYNSVTKMTSQVSCFMNNVTRYIQSFTDVYNIKWKRIEDKQHYLYWIVLILDSSTKN
jgi:hypothetical protein